MNISYSLHRNRRSKRLTLRIFPDGTVKVTSPYRLPKFFVDRFVEQKEEWISDALKKIEQRKSEYPHHPLMVKKTAAQKRAEYAEHKSAALALAKNRLAYFNQFYNFTYHNITIRNQSSRWGSCSKTGNLNFNYKIALLPPALADYIIVHELCHIGQFNHSKAFWSLVAQTIPSWKELRKQLHRMSL